MRSFKKYYKPILICLGAVNCGTYLYYNPHFADKRKVFTSWTTNYVPPNSSKWDDNWDQSPNSLIHPKKILNDTNNDKVVEKLNTLRSTATRHIILIRHGQYEIDGGTDEERKLTKLGCNQAKQTGKRLQQLGFPYTEMIKSTMKRAQETGTIISDFLPKVPVRECNFIREGAPVPPEPPVGHWKPEVYQFYQDGARIEAAFRQYFHRADPKQEHDSFTLLVCHANVIRYFVCRALQFPPEGWLRLSLNHASITWISIAPNGRVKLMALGDSGHMPPEMLTVS
ncbi:serine/threonine-protein phosphatase PGAM5, mitochondrial isoform X2 [Agrilus planipennis]|uniref:Serine/threonine-protein phosphatase PGAM5, mitochondrial n=1 Tax=Agrilus planipennis TaxID=224129 RepID=A0A1W4W2Y8_AGRPL|nr:serine/threonine-protein phosphatase PGAM5, mitochondrial isoform X2 [Agrilus planipennis]